MCCFLTRWIRSRSFWGETRIVPKHEQTLWVLVKEWGGLKVATNFLTSVTQDLRVISPPLGSWQLCSLYPMIKWCCIWFRVLVLRCWQLLFPVPWNSCCKENQLSCKNLAIWSPPCCEEAQAVTWRGEMPDQRPALKTSEPVTRHGREEASRLFQILLTYDCSCTDTLSESFPVNPQNRIVILNYVWGCLLYSNR